MGNDYLWGTSSAFIAENQLHSQNLLPWPGLCGGCKDLQGHPGPGNQSLREGFYVVVFGESLFRLEDGLYGSVIKMLTDVFNLFKRCRVLLKTMLGFPPVSDKKFQYM